MTDLNNKVYLNSEETIAAFAFRDGIYIYGAGMEGELFIKEMGSEIRIKGVIDSNKCNQVWHGLKIWSKEIFREVNVKGDLIVTCFDYRNEIVSELELEGLVAGKDFFIWDRLCSYKPDSSIYRLIEWNKNIWQYQTVNNECRALIPIHYCLHDGGAIMYSYLADYIRKKYATCIDTYTIHWKSNICPTVSAVYESFGVSNHLICNLSPEQEREAVFLFEEIWNGIHTFSDWKNIEVYGIHVGSVIIRTFLRFYVPDFDPRGQSQKDFLFECIKQIVYWYYRFESYDYRVVLTWDGGAYDSILANIAIAKGIPVYSMYFAAGRKMIFDDPWYGRQFKYYKEFWYQLSSEEKEYGLKWAKKTLQKRLSGQGKNHFEMKEAYDAFKTTKSETRITGDEVIKIVIVPHSFEDDSYMYGAQIFDDNYYSWLCHLGELSNIYYDYGWYMKIHPMSSKRDRIIVNDILKRYPNIKVLPERVSVIQMKEEGINWALTVQGSIGHEYPILGIEVINAGENPHETFDFNWNPKSVEEYDDLIANIYNLRPKDKVNEVYEYYCIDQLYYDYKKRFGEEFFDDKLLNADDQRLALSDVITRNGTWKYRIFLDTFTKEEHERLKKKIENYFNVFDSWREDIFYKKDLKFEKD